MTNQPSIHPDCLELAPLIGKWSGIGAGHYPTINNFEYREEVTFGHVGKPFLSMNQRTRDLSTGLPLHAEAGYLRAIGGGAVELVVAQPSGIVEIDIGSVEIDGDVLDLDLNSTLMEVAPSAKMVSGVRRHLRVVDDEMVVEMWMAAVGEPLTHHLRSVLKRN